MNKTTAAGFKFCPSGETGSEAAADVRQQLRGDSHADGGWFLLVANDVSLPSSSGARFSKGRLMSATWEPGFCPDFQTQGT